MYDIIERTGRAEYYLREARRAGLPLPRYITVSATDYVTWRSSSIGIQVGDPSVVLDWAVHFGAEIVRDQDGAARAALEETDRHHEVVVYCGKQEDEKQ